MRVRASTSLDKEISNEWRAVHGVPELPVEALPETGVVCERADGSKMIAMVWIYITNSKMAYVAWPVSNPQSKPREAYEALTLAVTELTSLARGLKVSYLVSTSSSRGLSKLLVQCGFGFSGGKHDLLVHDLAVTGGI